MHVVITGDRGPRPARRDKRVSVPASLIAMLTTMFVLFIVIIIIIIAAIVSGRPI